MKKIVSILFLYASFLQAGAQLTASADTAICNGRFVQISATGGGANYSWNPPAGLNNPNSANTIAAPTVTTTYVVTSQTQLANQFVNGDFSQGNTGFTSSYTYTTPPNNSGNAYYWVGATPSLFSGGMSNCSGDHTSGVDTNQLIADGAVVANTPVWCQTISVIPNTTYTLSGYIHPLNNTNMPGGRWTVNGTLLNGNNPPVLFPCLWTNFTATWNSGSNTSATFCVLSDRLQANGNDFAIDDLSITANVTLTDTLVITVNDNPTVNLGADTLICSSQSVTLDAGNAGAGYLWSDNSITQTISASGDGFFSVTVTDANQCTATDVIELTTYVLDAVVSTTNTTCGANNGTAAVTLNNGTSPFTYSWSDNSTGSSLTGLASGTYDVTVNDAAGCTATANGVVSSSTGGSVSITANQTQICASDSAEICAPDGYISYLWNTGQTSKCISTSLAGPYYVTVTDNGSCTATSTPVSISVYTQPPVSVSVNGDTLSAFNAVSYQWFFNGSEIPNAIDSVYVATQSGNYNVQIMDANGCYAMSNGIPIATGIESFEGNEWLEVFPNPNATGKWNLSVVERLIGKQMQVFDAAGKIVLQSTIVSRQSSVQLNVASGVYMLKIVSDGKSYWRKLVRI